PRSYTLSFFFTATATTQIYTLSLHDALPISLRRGRQDRARDAQGLRPGRPHRQRDVHADRSPPVDEDAHLHGQERQAGQGGRVRDRKSTRLNSSHVSISYAVFCLKKKKTKTE